LEAARARPLQRGDDIEKARPFWPDLAWRDVIVCTALILTIALLAHFIGPPALDKPPDSEKFGTNARRGQSVGSNT
jgi:hypothetical protein